MESDAKGNDAIDECIVAKVTKQYTYTGKLFQGVDIRAHLAEWEDIDADHFAQPRQLPKGPFDEIWLIIGDIDGDHIGQVSLK